MEPLAERYVGVSIKRSEDPRILTGRGQYVDDIHLPGMAHAAFLRSPVAHARIVRIDIAEARAAPGVLAVYTGDELEAMLVPGPYGAGGIVPGQPQHTCLATDKVRLVGDLVALVIAASRPLAEDATELIVVEYDELPAVANAEQAFDPARPPIFEELPSNVLAPLVTHTYGDIDSAFASAENVLRTRIRQHRHQNVPMETRGCVASFDPATERLEVWSSNQSVGHQRNGLASRLGMQPEQVRVRTADVGGSFGLKLLASREDVAVAAAARDLTVPVKYIEDRYEHLTAAGQAREEYVDIEVGYTNDGGILGLKAKMVIDTGAYPGLGTYIPNLVEALLPGPYKISGYQFDCTAVITNKATYVSYRGPWAVETFVRERVIDLVARELGMEPWQVRRRNVFTSADQPAAMITGRSLAGITVAESLDRLGEVIDVADFRKQQAEARHKGRYLGLGIASYIEAAPGTKKADGPLGAERVRMYLQADGKLAILTGQMPHGQGHETTLAQVAADEFGVAVEDVRVIVGDSDIVPLGLTGGSRAATMAGGAALTSARALKAKVLDAASQTLEVSSRDLRIQRGTLFVAGDPVPLMTLAGLVAQVRNHRGDLPDHDSDLSVEVIYDGGAGGWSGGSHAAIVAIDIETGLVKIQRYVVVEDCGILINPAIVDGQIRGGVTQGIGAVLFEHSAYDSDANYLTASFMDYLLPTAADVPRIEIHHLETIPLDPDVNFRGVGEGGMIVSPATLCNAIEDALSPFDVRIHEQHLPPARLLQLADLIDPKRDER